MRRFFLIVFFFALTACAPPDAPIPTRATPAPTVTTPQPATVSPTMPPALPTETPMATATPACAPQTRVSGQVGQGLLDKPMDYVVLLPPCYEQQAGARYPVLYLFHGLGADQEQWLRLGLAERAEAMMLAGEIPPFLVVLPFDFSFRQPGEYRFEEVFLEHLIPEIEARYRARDERAGRAVGGLSRGGAWAIYLASRNPHLFVAVGGHSPVVFSSTGGALTLLLRDIAPDLRPTFYIDAGDRDVDFRGIRAFTGLLNGYEYPHEWHSNLGYHDEAYWSAHLDDYLGWYGRQFENAP